ncbi:ribosomal protein L1/ribosomal biogenesis protein [Dichotomocladium elegans]|nr:ribosomal protein L1/ribosomal biogenesis protein [Dichotomocladium elegans]
MSSLEDRHLAQVMITIQIEKWVESIVINKAYVQAKSAYAALAKFERSKEDVDLLSSKNSYLFMQVVMKKIPSSFLEYCNRGKKIKAKHPLFPKDSNMCLFVKSDAKALEQELIKGGLKNVKVYAMDELKASFNTFERRRNLLMAHDSFYVDDRIVSFMPGLLGSVFLKKRKTTPFPVNLRVKNKVASMKTAFAGQYFNIMGPQVLLQVGHFGLSKDEVVENMLELLKGLEEHLPFEDIQEISLKTGTSPPLPFYNSLPM